LIRKRAKVKNCPECGSDDLIQDNEVGELVCENCGFVVSSSLLDTGPEWRAFNAEQRKRRTRVGGPLTLTIHDRGFSTIIDWHDRDAYGRRLKPHQKSKMYRIRKWHRRSKVSGSTERNLVFALSEITKVAYKLNLPRNIIETASFTYRKIVRKKLTRGRAIRDVASATIYMACRQCNVIRTLDEVSEAANIPKKKCASSYRFLLKNLEEDVPLYEPRRYVSKLINHLNLTGNAESIAIEILEQAKELKLTSGRSPAGLAAACIYIACILADERITQGDVAKSAKVTEVTIRNRYKEMIEEIKFSVRM
jgi:transcription initiation factor TFIIB